MVSLLSAQKPQFYLLTLKQSIFKKNCNNENRLHDKERVKQALKGTKNEALSEKKTTKKRFCSFV